MSKIRGKWTKPEKTFYAENPEAIPHPDWLPFRPDFLLEERPVFIDSTFWHGYVKANKYENMKPFWSDKLFRNILRDICRTHFWDLAGGCDVFIVGA